jgi:hypothetical protein
MSNQRKALPGTDSKTAIAVNAHGEFIYPSSRGLGHEQVSYPQRLPSVAKQPTAFRVISVKAKDLPGRLIGDLREAYRSGHLPEELSRQLDFLESSGGIDTGTLKFLKGFRADLTGHPGPDGETLESITAVIQSLKPTER